MCVSVAAPFDAMAGAVAATPLYRWGILDSAVVLRTVNAAQPPRVGTTPQAHTKQEFGPSETNAAQTSCTSPLTAGNSDTEGDVAGF